MTCFKTSDGVNIYYEVSGKGIPIVFIHGFAESGSVFRIQKRALAKKYKFITYDIRGHGRSDIVQYGLDMNRISLDLEEFFIHLQLDKYVVVAWSMGASILLHYIKNFGTNRLYKIVIVDKSPKMLNDSNWNLGIYHGQYDRGAWKDDLNLIEKDFPEFINKFSKDMANNLSEIEIEIAREKLRKNSKEVLLSLWKSMGESDFRKTLEKINIETLIVFGGKSKLYSTETAYYLRDNIKLSRLEVFKDNGHLLILENPRKFNDLLEDFIENGIDI